MGQLETHSREPCAVKVASTVRRGGVGKVPYGNSPAPYPTLTKGQRVLVVGEVEEPSTWTDQEGNTRASLEVTARTVRFLNTRAENEALAGGWGKQVDRSCRQLLVLTLTQCTFLM